MPPSCPPSTYRRRTSPCRDAGSGGAGPVAVDSPSAIVDVDTGGGVCSCTGRLVQTPAGHVDQARLRNGSPSLRSLRTDQLVVEIESTVGSSTLSASNIYRQDGRGFRELTVVFDEGFVEVIQVEEVTGTFE